VLYSRQYRAALLDYLLGADESGRGRAYELGRAAIHDNLSLLQFLRVHQWALDSILASTSTSHDRLRQLRASQEFLTESLSAFEMTYRGYVDLLQAHPNCPCHVNR
jgi:hypothetical protein